jgi:integrase
MGRRPLNKLRVAKKPFGWLLTGAIHGERIRERFDDFVKCSMRKAELEMQVVEAKAGQGLMRPVLTKLTDAEMHAFEAMRAWAVDRGAVLDEVLVWARANFPLGKNVNCQKCLDEWMDSLRERHRRERTLSKNRLRVEAFIRGLEDAPMRCITAEMVERRVLRRGVSPLTQIGDGQVLKTWLDWAVKRRYLAASPFQVDLEDLKGRVRPSSAPRILTPEDVSLLFKATESESRGKMLPYLCLALFCFLRNAEAQRTKPQHIHADAEDLYVEVFPVKSGTVSYRTVAIPANVAPFLRGAKVYFSKLMWNKIREKAGLLAGWQENILRHTGMSYRFLDTGDIGALTREAGNSSATAFRHYLSLAKPGDAQKFYATCPSL